MPGQRLFISHASEDAGVVDRIVAYLEARGVPCWISSRDIPPRAIYADAIAEGLQACSACVVVISRSSNASAAVKRELELASHYGRAFIPILIENTQPSSGVEYYLRNTQWLDYKRDGERALDRIVAQAKGGPLPRPASRRSSGGRSLIAVAAIAVIGLIGAGGWYAWSHSHSQPTAQTAVVSAEVLAPLLGAYNWQGLECGRGPVVTYEDSALVFTMPDVPTYRHEVLSATPASGGFALEVRSRVVSPQDRAGETYTLGLNGNALQVSTGDRIDAWTRCEIAATEPSPAPVSESRAPARHVGLAGSTWWGSYTSRLGATTAQGWQLNADGTACFSYTRYEYDAEWCAFYRYRWTAEGDRVTLTNGNNSWNGTVSGSTFSGTITDSNPDGPYTFTLRRE